MKENFKFWGVLLLTAGLLFVASRDISYAAGTCATTIPNTAAVSYLTDSGAGPYTATGSNNLNMDEIIDVNPTSLSSTTLKVLPGLVKTSHTLLLTNTGNGNEKYTIDPDGQPGDQFDPTIFGVFADTNNNGQYDLGTDLAIPPALPSGYEIDIACNARETVFIVADIPLTRNDGVSSVQDGDVGLVNINITNTTFGNGAVNISFVGGSDSGGTAFYNRTFPITLPLTYVVNNNVPSISVDITKASVVSDSFGGNIPYPGSAITYTLTVEASGSGSSDVVVTDQIPENTTYLAGSLILDGTALTDAADNDAGETSGPPVNEITINLSNQRRGTRAITFTVIIDE